MRRGSSANYRGEPMSDAVYVVLGFKGANGNLRFGLSEDPLGYVQNVRNGEYDGYRNLGASAEWCWACRVVSQDEGILLRNRLNGLMSADAAREARRLSAPSDVLSALHDLSAKFNAPATTDRRRSVLRQEARKELTAVELPEVSTKASEFIANNEHKIARDTPYERRFVMEVLPLISGLDWGALGAQTPFEDSAGTTRFIDFTIIESDAVRIAIEVDGFAFHGATSEQHTDGARRGQQLSAYGYTLVRVANSQIDRDPGECARLLELTLQEARRLGQRLAEIPEAERPSALEARQTMAGDLLSAADRSEMNSLLAKQSEAITELANAVTRLDQTSSSRASEPAGKTDAASSSGRNFPKRSLAIGAGLAALVTAVVVAASSLSSSEASPPSCSAAVPWDEASRSPRSLGTIKGNVVNVQNVGGKTYMNIGLDYPEPKRWSVVIANSELGAFEPGVQQLYENKQIAVSGRVDELSDKAASIEVSEPSQISTC
jgi:hypothetical protein